MVILLDMRAVVGESYERFPTARKRHVAVHHDSHYRDGIIDVKEKLCAATSAQYLKLL
jgi:hypothetical protein